MAAQLIAIMINNSSIVYCLFCPAFTLANNYCLDMSNRDYNWSV